MKSGQDESIKSHETEWKFYSSSKKYLKSAPPRTSDLVSRKVSDRLWAKKSVRSFPVLQSSATSQALTQEVRPPEMIVPLYNGHLPNENNNTIELTKSLDCDNATGYHTFQQNDIVYDEDGAVISGSAEALIRRLIPTRDYCPDRSYIFTLLLNIRTFVAPSELLHKVLQHCMFEQNATGENFTKEGRTRMFANIFKLCSEWTQNMPYDFRDESMRMQLGELLGMCSVDERSKLLTERLLADLQHTLNRLDRYERAITNLSPNNNEKLTQSENLSGLCELCPSPLELAQQLTQIELERLCMVGPDEIIYSLLKDNLDTIGKVASHSGASTSGNIGHYVTWFNQLTVLVASEILRHSKKQCRVRVIEYFIDVAKECINVGNFNSVMAIVAGLSLPPIARLRKTWLRVEKSKLQILQHQLDPSANFTSYRATLKAAIWRSEGAKNDAEAIIIPFFGLLLKDMLLLHNRCVRLLPNGHLNFASFAQFGEQMLNFINWKSRRCPFKRNSCVLQYLLLASTFSESDLMKLSFECEMADQSSEREHYKKLKCEK